MLRMLLVEDDVQIADFVVRGLREEGLIVEHAFDGATGWEALLRGSWDVVVLDWWLPACDGLTLLKRLRERGDATPVLFLTARDAVSDRVIGLEAGADDYLCKPFAFAELLARVRTLARRRPETVSPVLRGQDIELDLAAQRARRNGQPLELTAKEQALLAMFLQHPGQVLSRTRLYEHVWQERYDGLSNTLEVHVMELRRKLESHGPRVIHTSRGRGYWFGESAENRGSKSP
jgi:two-component system copper resistance phosphate regulon response regulator CusR